MKLTKTKNLNQASFLTALGGELLDIEDTYPNNYFVVRSSPFILWWEKHIGLVPYRKYCNQRTRLKERARKQSGLPAHFTGRSEGFNFADIAIVVDKRR